MDSGDLGLALTAARVADWPGTVRALLAAWRPHPAPELAAALEAASGKAIATSHAPIVASDGEKNSLWTQHARRGDPVEIGRLCASLRDTRRSGEVRRRIEMLLAHGPDPRLAMAVCDLLERPRYLVMQIDLRPFWERLWTWLPELGDSRVRDRVAQFPVAWQVLDSGSLFHLEAKLSEHQPAVDAAYPTHALLDDADGMACAEITALATSRTADEIECERRDEELRDAIYDQPLDLERRAIYADWLQDRGDPRGEYIALALLQTAPHQRLEPGRQKRFAALEHTFGARWKQPLVHASMWCGFLHSTTDTSPLPNDPRLATLQESHAIPISDGFRLPVLHTLNLDDLRLADLAQLTQPMAVRTVRWRMGENRNGMVHATYARISCLPALRRLEVALDRHSLHLDDIRALVAAPTTRPVRELIVCFPPPNLSLVVQIAAPLQLEKLGLVLDRNVMSVELSRGKDGLSELSASFGVRTELEHVDLVEMLGELTPYQLTSAQVYLGSVVPSLAVEWRERITKAMTRQVRLQKLTIFPFNGPSRVQ